jgi:hypothetical protein
MLRDGDPVEERLEGRVVDLDVSSALGWFLRHCKCAALKMAIPVPSKNRIFSAPGRLPKKRTSAPSCRTWRRPFHDPAVWGNAPNSVELLPSIEALRDGDPMSARVAEQIALGVSTRGYERSLESADKSIATRGTSKSNASRALIDATTENLAEFVSRKIDALELVAMLIDGIEFAGHSVVVALGVTLDGTKVPLGIWAGSTENTTLVTELLSNIVARGLRVEQPMRFAIDGGKALRRAVRDVFGTRAIVQRCQVHKAHNVRDHLPEAQGRMSQNRCVMHTTPRPPRRRRRSCFSSHRGSHPTARSGGFPLQARAWMARSSCARST